MKYLKFLPKNLLSRAVGRIMELEHPEAVAQWARDTFARYYRINLDEAEKPLGEYPNIAALFTRRLKPGLRPIGEGVVHPCDGKLTGVQEIKSDSLLQAKGLQYSLAELIGRSDSVNASKKYLGGLALTYYLCPTDYHRVHAPVDAIVAKVTHVPGTLWPVNEASVRWVPQLFAVNERLVFHLSTPLGVVLLVMVGATNVGKMTVSFDSSIATNCGHILARNDCGKIRDFIYPRAEIGRTVHVAKGEELGVFHMGSTVIVLYPPAFSFAGLPNKGPVCMGQSV